MQTLTTGYNKLRQVINTEKPYWRPFSYPPDRQFSFIRTYIRSSCYVEDFYVEAPAWKHLCEGAYAAGTLSLVAFVYGPFCVSLRIRFLRSLRIRTYVYVLTSTLFVFSLSAPLRIRFPFPLRIRSYVYVLTSTYLRRGSLGEKIFAKFFPKRFTRGFGKFLENFLAPLLRRIYYVEYITYNNTYIYTYIYTYIFYLFSTK